MLTSKTTQPRPSPAFEEVSCQGFDLFCSLTRRQLPATVPVRKVYGLPRASFSRNLAVQVLPLAMCLAPPPALRDFHPVEFAHAERNRVGEAFTYPSHTTGHAGLAPSGSNKPMRVAYLLPALLFPDRTTLLSEEYPSSEPYESALPLTFSNTC